MTTLVTYVATGAIAYWFAPKHRFLFAVGITAAATFSYESLYLSIDALFANGHGFGITNIFQYTGTIYFTLTVSSWIIKPKIDKWLLLLLGVDLFAWLLWLPSFHANSASRVFALATKTPLTLAILLPYRGDALPRIIDWFKS